MGDVQLARVDQAGRELVFAFDNTGEAVWAWDPVTGEQWWYAAERADDFRDAIAGAVTTFTAPQTERPGMALDTGRGHGVDLTTHKPGHAVLAHIATLHAEASTPGDDGFPGSLDDEVVNWCVGFVGEEETAAELARLSPRWRVIHSVPVGIGGSDIDHLLVGPAGVFVLNSKRHVGQNVDIKGDSTFVAGKYQHHVRNSRLEAKRATAVVQSTAEHLTAHPVVVVIGARLKVKEPPHDFTVVSLDQLVPWLESLPSSVSEPAVDALWQSLRWSAHWTTVMPPPAAPDDMADFARRIALERDLALTHKVRSPGRTRTGRANAAPSRRPRRESGARPTAPRRDAQWWRIGVVLGVAAVLLLFSGQITAAVQSVIRSLTPKLVPSTSAAPSNPVPKAGQKCPSKGSVSKTVQGKEVTCESIGNTGSLTWRPTG